MNNIPKDSGFVNRYISYPISNVFVPIIYKLGFTPNIVTTITLILRIIVIYNFYYKKNFMLIIILFLISWITDGMDGQLARNYNMKSKFGEIYDVTVDLATTIPIIVLFYIYYKKNRLPYYLVLCLIPIFSIIKTLKIKCKKHQDKNEIKEWENFFNNKNFIINKKNCKYLKFTNLYDEGLNYLIILIFFIYTFYFHEE